MTLLTLCLAPILICCFYVFIRDKYEKEPISILLKGVFFGVLIAYPILKVEMYLSNNMPQFSNDYFIAFYDSFIVASFTEEIFKFLVVILLFFRDRNYNERFDGIVYAVFVSLGFAMAENFAYVYSPTLGGVQTAILRMVFSVPLHAFFGVTMGYYLSLYKFEKYCHRRFLVYSFLITFIIHGLYDFILMSNIYYLVFPYVLFLVYIVLDAFRKMKTHINKSPFKN